jgi:cytochrome P450 family 135
MNVADPLPSMSMGALPPGPSEPPLIQTLRWFTRPVAFMESCRKRYGDTFGVTFLGFERPMVMLGDPEAVRALYSEQSHGLPPGRSLSLLPVLGPNSVLLLEGREHLARRRLMLPPFHGERMRSYETIVRDAARRELAQWREGEAFAIHPRMQAITLDVILRAVFGVTDPERRTQLVQQLPRLLGGVSSTALQLRVLLSRRFGRGEPLTDLQRLMSSIDELLLAEIAERRAEGENEEREDILALLMAARFEDGSAMEDRELRDQLLTLLLAGHETTATALAWTFDLLLANPAALARLTQEIDAGEDDAYLRATITESLRLRPVVPLAGRRLARDLKCEGLDLPAGTDVTPAIWLVHTRPDLYPEPYAFRPERFLENGPPTYGWVPFGGGVRRCLGAAFAEFEMRIVLETVLRECALERAGGRGERIARRNVTLAPRNGTRVRVRPRAAARERRLVAV